MSTNVFDLPVRGPLEIVPWDGVDSLWTARRLSEATWAFVVLGVVLRVVRYLLNFPLWGDEAFVAANFIARGYRDLLQPLDYGQICPILFLWIEHTAVKLLGYRELSLRLFPMACGVASMFLFRYVAGRVVQGVPLLLAVGIFAVSFHPIRHAAEVKPYASDLLVALMLLAPALEWWRSPARTGWLWVLVAVVPVAVALSHPAVFVAGGIGLGLAVPVWRSGRRGVRLAFALFHLALVATFLLLFIAFTCEQGGAVLQALRAYWAGSFPPLGDPGKLLRWLILIHTGTMFAYPGGGQDGASTLTFVCVAAAAVVLWRRGRRAVLVTLLGPFALALVAAALRRYPYGGEARQMQFGAPAICVMAGLGAAALLRVVPGSQVRIRAVSTGVLMLVLGGLMSLAHDAAHPYRSASDHSVREFAAVLARAGAGGRTGLPPLGLWNRGPRLAESPIGTLPLQPAHLLPATPSRGRPALERGLDFPTLALRAPPRDPAQLSRRRGVVGPDVVALRPSQDRGDRHRPGRGQGGTEDRAPAGP